MNFKALVANLTLKQLQQLVNSEVWKANEDLTDAIFDRYVELTETEVFTNFGTPEFWDHILGLEDENEPQPEETSSNSAETSEINENEQQDVDSPGPSHREQIGGAERQDDNLQRHVDVSETYRMEVRRLRTEGVAFDLRFRDMDTAADILAVARHAFETLLNRAFADGAETDRVGIQINHPELQDPILLPFRKKTELDANKILNLIERVQQSRRNFSLDSRIRVIFTRIKTPAGRGGRHTFRGNFDEWFKKRTGPHGGCLIQVRNNDELCLARALIIAIAHAEKDDSDQKMKEWNRIRLGDRDARHRDYLQRNRARDLMQRAGLGNHVGACSLTELSQLHAAIPQYHIKVFSKECFFAKVYDHGGPAKKLVHLFHYNDHFCVISKICAFFDVSYYCNACDRGFDVRQDHTCESRCNNCYDPTPCDFVQWTPCADCSRVFRSTQCYDKHKLQEQRTGAKRRKIPSICQTVKKCKQCDKLIQPLRRGNDHSCGLSWCATCHTHVNPINHKCFIRRFKEPKSKNTAASQRYLYFDLETSQDTEYAKSEHGIIYQHRVNCVVCITVCDLCKADIEKECGNCGPQKQRVFKGWDSLHAFCVYLFSEQHVGVIAVAHNSRSFDSQFLLQYLQQQGVKPTSLVLRGLEILKLEAVGVKIIDSLSFLPFPLVQFSKAFNLTVAKGHFPHFANTEANWNMDSDTLPDSSLYGVDDMKEDARTKFFAWYHKEKEDMQKEGRRFNLQDQLELYCKLDVLVLAKGCTKFRELFIEVTGVDPFKSTITIASACNLVFRRNFLRKDDMIGIVPHLGYRKEARQSIKAIKFLKWFAHKNDLAAQGQYIQHSKNESEFRIGKYKVDGLLRSITTGDSLMHVFEYSGCAWHGCSDCYKDRSKILPCGLTAQEAFDRTLQRRLHLESLGYQVTEFWECHVDRMIKQDQEMAEFMRSVNITEPLDPRDAFYGGRTNCVKLHHKCGPGETLSWYDITSLYPFICKYGCFPLGHPQIYTENFKRVDQHSHPYKGLMKCSVKPPRKLLHPVLPMRVGGKLTFPLCMKCITEGQGEECEHTDEERMLIGTWTTLELYASLDCGYEIDTIFEVYHYTRWAKYDGKNADTGLFNTYIDCFLKIKQEASGYPDWVKTEDDKDKYVDDYMEVEGIRLDKSKIEPNSALRQLAKLSLNSFWGKFGQRNNMGQMEFFDQPEPYFDVVCDEENEVSSVRIVGENLVSVAYKKAEPYVEPMPHTSVVIAAFVTAQSRLHLLGYMFKLQDRVVYFDTDSLIYFTRPCDIYTIPLGDHLGSWTNELSSHGPGSYIDEFVGAGPKAYGVKIWNTNEKQFKFVVKIKGFTLSSKVSNTLNFESLKRLVKQFIETGDREVVTVRGRQIRRTEERQMVTRPLVKKYSVVYDKRILVTEDCTTLPFGF